MAYELHGVLTDAVSTKTGEKVMPAYGGGFESFLNNVVTPIYRVIYEVHLQSNPIFVNISIKHLIFLSKTEGSCKKQKWDS